MAKKQTEFDKFLIHVSGWLNWIWLIAIAFNIILPAFASARTTYYPLNVLILSALAVWLFHFEQKWISLLVIIISLYIHYTHFFP